MLKIEGRIQFQTTRPISQETGLEMWKLGSHFAALTGHGGRTYQLTTSGSAMTMLSFVSGLVEMIQHLVENDGHNEATMTAINLQGRL